MRLSRFRLGRRRRAAYYDCQYPLKGYQCEHYAYHHALFRIARAVANVVGNQAGQSDGTKAGRIERTVSIEARSEEHDDKPACAKCAVRLGANSIEEAHSHGSVRGVIHDMLKTVSVSVAIIARPLRLVAQPTDAGARA